MEELNDSKDLMNTHIRFISDLNKAIEANNITMVYEGKIDQEIIKSISNTIEKKMTDEGQSFKINRLIFHISIEMLQNIGKYSDDDTKGKGIIVVGKTLSGNYISSGNIIENEKIESLKNRIDYLNKLNKDELNELYHSQISEGQFNQKAGAGLGLIDIIRKSGNKLLFNFELLNSKQSFFLLTANVIK